MAAPVQQPTGVVRALADRRDSSSTSSGDEPVTPDSAQHVLASGESRDATPRGSTLPGALATHAPQAASPATPVVPAPPNPISRVLGGFLRSMADAIAPDPASTAAPPPRSSTPTSLQTRRVARSATASSNGVSPISPDSAGSGGFSFGMPQLNLNLAGLQMFGGNGEGRSRVGSSSQDGIVLGSPIGLEDQQPDKTSNLRIEDGAAMTLPIRLTD